MQCLKLADELGFEPKRPFKGVLRFSKPVPLAAQPLVYNVDFENLAEELGFEPRKLVKVY